MELPTAIPTIIALVRAPIAVPNLIRKDDEGASMSKPRPTPCACRRRRRVGEKKNAKHW